MARLLRAATLVGGDELALAKAQAAVIGGAANAEALLAAVPASLQGDPSFIFARAQLLRRADKIGEAAVLLAAPPRRGLAGRRRCVVGRAPDVARKLLDAGDAATAYRLCAEPAAASPAMRIEAQFHAGWIALRFLHDASLAAPHFAAAAAIATTPASMARAAYWQGRTAQALGGRAGRGAQPISWRRISQTTYYGQLARRQARARRSQLRAA